MARWTLLLAATLTLTALAPAPAQASGPCDGDNDLEKVYCDTVESVHQALWWLCNHGVEEACELRDLITIRDLVAVRVLLP